MVVRPFSMVKAIITLNHSRSFTSSVTRFGEISPLLPKVNNLWQTLYCLFSVSQHFEPTLAKLYVFGANLIVVNGDILKNNLAIWSHCLPGKFVRLPSDHDFHHAIPSSVDTSVPSNLQSGLPIPHQQIRLYSR